MAEIEQEIRTLVSKVIKVPEEKLKSDVNIFSEYGVDSLLGVEILAGLDKKYGIDVPEDKIRHIKSVNDIVNITKELIAKKGR
jgi:acyl carrier protein